MSKRVLGVLGMACCLLGHAAEPIQSETVWDAIHVFEGNPATVSTDFDCQGISIGVAQWNVGKSYSSVKAIISAVSAEQVRGLMPEAGTEFTRVLGLGKEQTLSYVRSLQTIARPDSCDAKTRNAQWNEKGRVFARELSRLLATTESIAKQRGLRADIFANGLKNANLWATSIRGKNAAPSAKEVGYFVDMYNFNGGGLEKFGLRYEPLGPDERRRCIAETINYLKTADEKFLLHKVAARKNADFLNPESLTDTDKDLFCFAYKVGKSLNRDYSRQFRLTTINRRAAILFSEAYYADRDARPTKITFPSA